MLKSCKRLKYVKFIVLIVKKNLWTSEVLFTKKQNKNPDSNRSNAVNDTGTY